MQIEMALKHRQAQLATQVALGKERFKYYSFVVGLAWFFLPIGAIKTQNPRLMIPLVPLGTGWCFQYDMLYGTMMRRAQVEAERLIRHEPERFFLPPNSGIIN